MTHKQVQEMFKRAQRVAIEAGVPISNKIDPVIKFAKATSWLGMCHYCNTGVYDQYIRISEYHIKDDEQEVFATLLHELIHTVKDCSNHGPNFKHWAQVLTEATGIEIGVVGHSKSCSKMRRIKTARSNKGHLVKCEGCGCQWRRTRHSNLTLHPELYHCNGCGGKLTLVY